MEHESLLSIGSKVGEKILLRMIFRFDSCDDIVLKCSTH